MHETIELTASDGHRFALYQVLPSGAARGSVLVIQEIFGVNAHIRELCHRYAAAGYRAAAPALYDRVQRGVELNYDAAGIEAGRAIVAQIPQQKTLDDLATAVAALRSTGRVGVVGYCYGGAMAWLAACKIDGVAAASCYYGGLIHQYCQLQPRCPVQLHFGELDAMIPLTKVDEIAAAHPELPVYRYPADHGFGCDHRASYHAPSAELAEQRTLQLFAEALVQGT